MPAFHQGELLIGGMALRHIHGQLEQEEPVADSHCWLLAGKLEISSVEGGQLELRRQYLLKLNDGREGLVELTRLAPEDGHVAAEFRPRAKMAAQCS